MKRLVKKGIIFISIIAIFFIFIAIFSRYGWKLFGFSMCSEPIGLYADSINVERDIVNLRLNEADSISSYAGYVYKIVDDSLYLGVNRNMLFAVFSGNVDYHISIRTNGTQIRYIYFRDNKNDWLIWNEDEGRIGASEIKPQEY